MVDGGTGRRAICSTSRSAHFISKVRAGVEADPSGSRRTDNRVLIHTNNLVCLCRRHHREHHRHAFDIDGDPEVLFGAGPSGGDGLRFIDQVAELAAKAPVRSKPENPGAP